MRVPVCVRVRTFSRTHRISGRASNEAGGPMERGHLQDSDPSAAGQYISRYICIPNHWRTQGGGGRLAGWAGHCLR